jgi:hypothetical protein
MPESGIFGSIVAFVVYEKEIADGIKTFFCLNNIDAL